MSDAPADSLKEAVVLVGSARGFAVKTRNDERWVVAAAHCLHALPPPQELMFPEKRTYADLLGSLGGERTVCAEALFVDPTSDLVVLGEPDVVMLPDEWRTYMEFMERPALTVGLAKQSGWLLSLEGDWLPCKCESTDPAERWLKVSGANIEGGMSGSPIVDDEGHAMGVVSSDDASPGLAVNLRLELAVRLMGEAAAESVHALLRREEDRRRAATAAFGKLSEEGRGNPEVDESRKETKEGGGDEHT